MPVLPLHPYCRFKKAHLYLGNCLKIMPQLSESSIDAIVTNPPYGLGFMGKDWDHGVPGKHFWIEALRVAKPGCHLLAFGGTRTFHRLACAIEDAGWQIRDTIGWCYGSGFPKSLDVSKAIDKAAGAERELLGVGSADCEFIRRGEPCRGHGDKNGRFGETIHAELTAPATDAARQWQGWGTALKPAWEPVILARKPLIGTVAENVLKHGTGGINVDGCRVEGPPSGLKPYTRYVDQRKSQAANHRNVTFTDHPSGRWPANLVLTYPEDSYKLRDDVTPEQLRALAEWMDENPQL